MPPIIRSGGIKIVAAFRGMLVSPAKHRYAWLPRACDYRTDRRTDGQKDAEHRDPYVPLCFTGDTKMEVKGHVFQINDNNRSKFLKMFNIPYVPNMITLSLTIKKLGAMLKFLESRSKVTIKVMWSKRMLQPERSWCKEHTSLIWKPYVLW